MKIIFLEDVPSVAKTGEIKDVASGYVRNYLIPRRLAMVATPAAIKNLEAELKIRSRKQARTDAELAALAEQLEGKEITISVQAGSKARLYGSVTPADVAAALKKAGLVIDKRKIDLNRPIHQLGTYDIPIKLKRDLAPKIKVSVVEKEAGEGGQSEATPA